jgi:hypothetical protein
MTKATCCGIGPARSTPRRTRWMRSMALSHSHCAYCRTTGIFVWGRGNRSVRGDGSFSPVVRVLCAFTPLTWRDVVQDGLPMAPLASHITHTLTHIHLYRDGKTTGVSSEWRSGLFSTNPNSSGNNPPFLRNPISPDEYPRANGASRTNPITLTTTTETVTFWKRNFSN